MSAADSQGEVPTYEVIVAVRKGDAAGVWGVRQFHRAVAIALGPTALAIVLGAWLAVAAPGIWLCTHDVRHSIFVGLAALAITFGGRPGLNLVGCLGWTAAASLAYAGLGLIGRPAGPVTAWATAYPLLAWFAGGAIRGTTMQAVGRAMDRDRRVYERLREAGQLIAHVWA